MLETVTHPVSENRYQVHQSKIQVFLYILQENEDCPDPLEKENPPAFLHRHRHRLYAFYQLVCDWIESRGEYGYNPLINISGL